MLHFRGEPLTNQSRSVKSGEAYQVHPKKNNDKSETIKKGKRSKSPDSVKELIHLSSDDEIIDIEAVKTDKTPAKRKSGTYSGSVKKSKNIL